MHDSNLDILLDYDLPVLLCILKDGVIKKTNREFVRRLGYAPEELSGKPFRDLVPPDGPTPALESRPLSAAAPDDCLYEHDLMAKNGGALYVLRSDTRVRYEDAPATLACFINVTDRKELEYKLRESNEKLQRMFDSLADGVTVTDYRGSITEINGRAVGLHGYGGREEMIGTTAYDFVAPRDHQKMRLNIREALRKGVSREVEFTFIRRDGSEFLVELTTSVLHNSLGKAIGFIGVTRDITQRKRYEETLRHSERFNANLLSNSPIPITVINPDTSIRYVNPALENITGYESRDLIGLKFPYPWWIKGLADETGGFHLEGIRRGRAQGKNLFNKKNGDLFWVENTFIVVPEKGQAQYYISSWVDITEQVKLQENMRHYLRKITRAQEEERKRIARELHDETLQTLIGLCMDIDDIISVGSDLSDITRQRLGDFRTKINGALEEIRRFSHELRPEVLDRFGLIPSLEVVIQEISRGGLFGCDLRVVGSEMRLPPEAELVLFRITQEALNNIRKHARATQAWVELRFKSREIELEISDNGTGFTPENDTDNLISNGKFGIMGMKERIRLCNGALRINTRPGSGTTVTARLPI